MDVSLPLLFLITAGAAFVQGFSGFGFGILVMAGMSLSGADLERSSVYATLSLILLVSTLLLRGRSRMRVNWKAAGAVTVGVVLTTPIGYHFILRHGDMPLCRLVFGVMLVLFALHRACKPHLKRHLPLWHAPFFGMISGLLNGAFSSGGPPVVMYLYSQEEDPRMAVGTTQAVFLGCNLYRLAVVLAGERGITSPLLTQTFCMAPVIILMTLLGFHFAHRLPMRPFLMVVYAIIAFAGLLNISKGFGL